MMKKPIHESFPALSYLMSLSKEDGKLTNSQLSGGVFDVSLNLVSIYLNPPSDGSERKQLRKLKENTILTITIPTFSEDQYKENILSPLD